MIKVILAYVVASVAVAHNILDYGAVVDEITHDAEVANSNAIKAAIQAANSDDNDDRLVEIPAHTFSTLPIRNENINNITMQIDGTILASKDWKSYTTTVDLILGTQIDHVLSFYDSCNLLFTGSGVIDG